MAAMILVATSGDLLSGGLVMSRQPLIRKYPNSHFVVGPGALEDRPKAAARIAECISGWTEVELQVARLLATLLGANTRPTIALYLSLANERAKRDALNAIVQFTLSAAEQELFAAILGAKASVGKKRHDLAHGLFCEIKQEDEGIGWISTADRIRHLLSLGSIDNPDPIIDADVRPLISVYTLPDLDRILDEIANVHRLVYSFNSMMRAAGDARAELFSQLTNEPLVQESRSRTKKDRGTPPSEPQ